MSNDKKINLWERKFCRTFAFERNRESSLPLPFRKWNHLSLLVPFLDNIEGIFLVIIKSPILKGEF